MHLNAQFIAQSYTPYMAIWLVTHLPNQYFQS